ncbi:MAG: alpha/beta hydrolase [Acidimicrobiales bacterium]|nr:alpha/beta hydrolase [Acidimicrobiales bacterium]
MATAAVNGITIEYDVQGDGEPLLFVMGLGGQLTDWRDDFVGPFVDRGFKVIRYDNRDSGLSSQGTWKPPNRASIIRSILTRQPVKGVAYSMVDMAADAVGLLGHLGIDSAHVVGMSMGGMIVQEIAINHPTRVRTVCSIMSNTGDRRNGAIAASLIPKFAWRSKPTIENAVEDNVEIFRLISGPHFDAEEYREHAKLNVARSFQPEGMERQMAAISSTRDRTKLLASVTAPTLVIHGLVDPLVKPSGGLTTAKAVPGSRFLGIPDMGHDLPESRWTEIREAIVDNCRRANSDL